MICSIVGVFCNTLTLNDNYPVQDSENVSSPIQMHLSLEPKSFSDSFVPFLESTSNFKYFEQKDDHQTYFISDINECEKLGETNP